MQQWKKHIEERLRGLGLSPIREAEILEELSQHLDDRYRELLANGVDRQGAYTSTVAELNESLHRELRRIERRVDQEPVILGTGDSNIMKDLFQDLRYTLRVLRKNPGFTAVAVLSLALGIGANTAIFQLFDAVFLRTLPVNAPEQLAEVRIPPTPGGRTGKIHGTRPALTYAQWEQIRDRQQVFSDVFAWGGETFNLARGGEARYARGLWVSGDFFRVLGVKPALGRVFQPADDRKGAGSQLAVISYAFWKSGFGG
ncbi:MAG: ABC transporter permease, partial [Blastocatellia bacterium]